VKQTAYYPDEPYANLYGVTNDVNDINTCLIARAELRDRRTIGIAMTELSAPFAPDWVLTPGDAVLDLAEERGWTQGELPCGWATAKNTSASSSMARRPSRWMLSKGWNACWTALWTSGSS
jgi:hypothetical protein